MTKEEKDIIKGVIYPKLPEEYGEVKSDILYVYKKFKPITSISEIKKIIDEFLVYKYEDTERTATCKHITAEQWATQKWTELMMKHRKCSNTKCDWECPILGALSYHYCAKCGALLPYREEVYIINKSEHKQLSEKAEKSGWAKIKESLF
ncbi:MAG: hypothetical protein J6Q22_19330 [Prevotella sp.]|nr:hypothetical protein [Prevotella sp.]